LREEVFKKYQTVFIILGILSGIFASCLSYLLGFWAFIMVLTATGTGAFYGFRIVPRKWVKYLKFQRIKDIPASKDIVVALAWSSITVFVPFLSENNTIDDPVNLILTWLFVFLLVYIRSVMLDIKDIQGDKLVGKETIPLILGEKKALLIVKVILFFEMGLILSATAFGVFELPAIFQLIALLPVVMVIQKYREGKLRRRYCYQALLDLSYIVSGIMAAFSYLQ